MSTISRVLVQLVYPDIFTIDNTSRIDLKGWIANQKYFVDELPSRNEFKLSVSYTEYLFTAFVNDCNKLACASFESIEGIRKEPVFPRCSGWLLIRAYYASFFAAHALLRMFARSCTQLEKQHVAKVFENANALGKTGSVDKIESGLYSASTDLASKIVTFSKLQESHIDTWSEFKKLIQFMIDNIDRTTALAQNRLDSLEYLGNLKNTISRAGCAAKGSWLSLIRNNVNYRQGYGTWFPYNNAVCSCDEIARFLTEWKHDPQVVIRPTTTNEMELFTSTCASVVSLLRDLIVEAVNNRVSKKHILRNGAFKILNLASAVN